MLIQFLSNGKSFFDGKINSAMTAITKKLKLILFTPLHSTKSEIQINPPANLPQIKFIQDFT